MKREVYPGGTYCDALPGGPRIVSYLTSPNSERQLYTRIHPAGIRYAFVGHETDHAWEWDGTQFLDHGLAVGVNAVIYNNSGTLHVNGPGAPHGTQGFRFFDEGGKLWTGDTTYNGRDQYGLAEWTKQGDVVIGQSYVAGDACTVLHDGVRRILEPGHCRFIRFARVGSQCAVACWKMQENAAVLLWFDVSEIASLPLEVKPPEPGNPPQPPQEKPVEPNWKPLLNYLRDEWHRTTINARSLPPDYPNGVGNEPKYSPAQYQRNRIMQGEAFQGFMAEWHHVGAHRDYGLLTQDPGRSNINGFSDDYVCIKDDTGTVWSGDVIENMGTNWSGIVGDHHRPTVEARQGAFAVPPPASGGDDGDPGDETDPPPNPPAPDLASLTREMVELRSHIAALIAMNAELQTQINDSDDVMLKLAQQVAGLDQRTAKKGDRITVVGTLRFSNKVTSEGTL